MPNVFYPYYLEPWEPMRASGEATIQRPIHVAMERAMPSVTDGEDMPADDVSGLKAIAKASDYVFGLPPHSAVYLQCPDVFDIVSTAKGLGGGLPIGACLMGEKVQDVLAPGDHGSTFGGNPAVCAGAVSILSRIDDALLEGVRQRSAYIFEQLTGAPGVEGVSGLGLMIGVKTVKPAREVVMQCLDNGVLFLTAKDRVRLLPALNIPMELLEKAVGVLKEVCAE